MPHLGLEFVECPISAPVVSHRLHLGHGGTLNSVAGAEYLEFWRMQLYCSFKVPGRLCEFLMPAVGYRAGQPARLAR